MRRRGDRHRGLQAEPGVAPGHHGHPAGEIETGQDVLKHFAALVRRGPGNEAERLRLLDAHRRRVDAQTQALEECRSLITWKVGVYAAHLSRGEADGLWDPTT